MSKIWGGRKFYLIIGVLSFSFLCKAEYFIGDLNNDCQINVADLVILAEQWLTTGPDADLNQDSIVNLEDYALFSANWKKKIREVIISEFLASNNSSIKDEDANTSDWVELYNMTPEPVSLLGWYLTDDADNLTKWSFPNIMIGGGDVLVIFASGQDRRNPASPLHTNFSLSANGEYLALVKPDGSTIAYEYKPNFPQQVTDISYGVAITGQNDMLIAGGAGCKYLIPGSEASLPSNWNATTLDDTVWQNAVLGVGYDTSTWGMTPENLALGKTATQTTDYSTSFLASNAVDGDLATFSHTANADTNATWQVNLGDDYYISQIILYNRVNCCWPRFRDITVTIRDPLDTVDLFVSDLLNPENILRLLRLICRLWWELPSWEGSSKYTERRTRTHPVGVSVPTPELPVRMC
jgi:hypothetical protein